MAAKTMKRLMICVQTLRRREGFDGKGRLSPFCFVVSFTCIYTGDTFCCYNLSNFARDVVKNVFFRQYAMYYSILLNIKCRNTDTALSFSEQ